MDFEVVVVVRVKVRVRVREEVMSEQVEQVV